MHLVQSAGIVFEAQRLGQGEDVGQQFSVGLEGVHQRQQQRRKPEQRADDQDEVNQDPAKPSSPLHSSASLDFITRSWMRVMMRTMTNKIVDLAVA